MNSSISSRARFSLGWPLVFSGASSQTRSAGSRSIACKSRPNGPRPSERKRLVLPPHQGQVVDLEVAGGEVVVPHQRQPLGQRVRAEEHAVDPPAFEAIGLGRGQRQLGQAVGERGEIRGNAAGSGLPFQQPVDRRFGAVLQVAPDLVPGGGEAGPAVQVDDPAEVPGRIGVGDISRPGVARLRRIRIGPHRDLLPGPITRPRP